jgi:uncharacterized protein (TIGR03118 family)
LVSAHHPRRIRWTRRYSVAVGAVAVAGLVLAISAFAGSGKPRTNNANLVSDVGTAKIHDSKLVNAWGLSFGPNTPAWVSDNGTDTSTLYQGYNANTNQVQKVPLNVSIPGGEPTGTVFNGSSAFVVHGGGHSAPADFLFDSEAGKITAWSQNVPPLTQARVMKSVPGAVFKGLAIGKAGGKQRLYATDFHGGRVDVFNGNFGMVHHKGAFRDRKIPNGYAPFGIQNVRGKIFVTYAKQDSMGEDDVKGPHHGFVDIYSTKGKLLDRFARRGDLNSPWGIARAPKGWAHVGGDMLIGNFGDGWINVFNRKTGHEVGPITTQRGFVRRIDGLWALEFGNGVLGTPQTLLYTAGPNDENHGLLGALRPLKSSGGGGGGGGY